MLLEQLINLTQEQLGHTLNVQLKDKNPTATGWERVKAFEIGMPKIYWSFLSHKTQEEYEKQITNGQFDLQSACS